MNVTVNGEPRDVPDGIDLRALVLRFDFRPEAVAAAVNGEVVARARHAERVLSEGDRIEVIRAVGGG